MNDTATARERLDRLLSRATDHANRASMSAIGSLLQELREALADRERFSGSLVEEFVRARTPEALRTPVMNVLSSAGSSVALEDLDELTELLATVILIEGTSLGTPEAQRVRESASQADLATVERLGSLLEQAGSALASGPHKSAPPRFEDDLAEAIRLVDQLRESFLVQYRNMDQLHARLERLQVHMTDGREPAGQPQREQEDAHPAAPPDAELAPVAADWPETTFWGSLTQAERRALKAISRDHTYLTGVDLCREGEPAQEVIIILSGWVRERVERNGVERLTAFRGAGDVVGERSALMLRRHSATATAASSIRALRVGVAEFAGFLSEHPRVVALLEKQLYHQISQPGRQATPAEVSDGDSTILIIEIHGFGSSRLDDDRRYLRNAMYAALEEAFTASGIDFASLHMEDRGDGALVVVPPGIPTRLLIDPMAAHLAAELRRQNQRDAERFRLRLRAVVHSGYVQRDLEGVSGEPIIAAARIADAPRVKERVARTAADLAIVVSNSVYEDVIASGHGFTDPRRFSRVPVRTKETRTWAWLTLDGAAQGALT